MMRFVEVEDVIDPGEYLARLPGLQDRCRQGLGPSPRIRTTTTSTPRGA